MRLRTAWHLNGSAYFAIDYVLLLTSTIVAFAVSPSFPWGISTAIRSSHEVQIVVGVMPLCMALGLSLMGVQATRVGVPWADTAISIGTGIGLGIVTYIVGSTLFAYTLTGRYIVVIAGGFGAPLVLLSRCVIWTLGGARMRRVRVLGSDEGMRSLKAMIAASRAPISVLGCHEAMATAADPRKCTDVGIVLAHEGDELVIERARDLAAVERQRLVEMSLNGNAVLAINEFCEQNLRRVFVESIDAEWMWGFESSQLSPLYARLKRGMDVCVSIVGLTSLAFLFPILYVSIKLQDGGPFFYTQRRVGKFNKEFLILKIRTMRVDAEASGPQWAKVQDRRVTLLGRVLRKTRLDEIPQFWNILIGEMSFIGPRPERPEFVRVISDQVPWYNARHLILPGLTGWAQINHPYGASVEDAREKLSYDLYYIKHASLNLDLIIGFKTIAAMIKGAR